MTTATKCSSDSVLTDGDVRNYINGNFVSTADTIDDFGPATGTVIARIPRSQQADVDNAVAAAKSAYPEWKATPVAVRAEYLHKICAAIQKEAAHLAELETLDCGKPISLTSQVEIPRAALNFKFFAEFATGDETQSHEMADAVNITQRAPVGVAALITPWNLPLYLLTWKVAPALLCGNTIVAKPSELTPLTANALAQIIHSVGLPAGVFNLVHGYGAECGGPLVGHEDVSLVSFTGGTATGKLVAATAAPQFKKLSLELGGKNAAIIFKDCENDDWDNMIATTVRSSFLNSGQVCLCCSRILVEESVYDRFVTDFVKGVEALRIGRPLDKDTTTGALSSRAHVEKVRSYIQLAKEEGGVILTGGVIPDLKEEFAEGFWLKPTVIAGLDPRTSRVATEEIFGPVVTIHTFKDAADAVDIHNSVKYGLAGTLWTSNLKQAHAVSRQMHTGMVWVNTWLHRDLRVPFGGVMASGVGREGGKHSLEFFSELKNICFKY
ncbi:hypothetical protein SARC_09956 [Sphaeroforma arctica JP610]|uniref:Aldehyde dehydrogenase domain-containing protein n=1 Tax=Sphaeroforma arctica JP610 TaxID=667725 RepID=A0A0L0FM89_9EUKA|nr:hypothetical protein SARC_09956 [Sphaeroforma arctica JP610]KNC77581.1 hypothetical protein SARC_09956 [Sphaeroforma arctica JP610]|eukprot:XP_014151483.1 hypothetical protein SARC_09956 [Sphaeroforma arctica JP610]